MRCYQPGNRYIDRGHGLKNHYHLTKLAGFVTLHKVAHENDGLTLERLT